MLSGRPCVTILLCRSYLRQHTTLPLACLAGALVTPAAASLPLLLPGSCAGYCCWTRHQRPQGQPGHLLPGQSQVWGVCGAAPGPVAGAFGRRRQRKGGCCHEGALATANPVVYKQVYYSSNCFAQQLGQDSQQRNMSGLVGRGCVLCQAAM
jgi:hypothetical protein